MHHSFPTLGFSDLILRFLLGRKGGGDEKQGGNCGREPPNTSHGNDSATPPATGQDRQRCRNKERRLSSPHPTPDPIHAGRLARLRAVLHARGIDGFVIPITTGRAPWRERECT